MDDEERMELALNSNFDSELFDCWDEVDDTNKVALAVPGVGEPNESQNNDCNADDRVAGMSRKRCAGVARDGSDDRQASADEWTAPEAFDPFARLPSFSMDNDYDGRSSERDGLEGTTEMTDSAEERLLSPLKVSPSTAPLNSSNPRGSDTLGKGTGEDISAAKRELVLPPAAVSSYSSVASGSGRTESSSSMKNSSSLVPPLQRLNATSDSSASTTVTMGGVQSQTKSTNAGAAAARRGSAAANLGIATLPVDLQNSAFFPLAINNPFLMNAITNANNHAIAAAAVAAAIANPLTTQSGPGLGTSVTTTSSSSSIPLQQQQSSAGPAAASTAAPIVPSPSPLFDAPVELRMNFQNCMRAHGLSTTPTLYPFGVPVNGFHPQAIRSAGGNNPNLKLVDATRNGLMAGEKRLKNVKEQQRAQKIAELIDELRTKMQKSGWSVGASKSKFNTLSSCADYVKHLVKITKEKEEAVQQARNDLEATKRKIEEERSQLEPSDPESTTSSLTVSSSSATGTGNVEAFQDRKKRALPEGDSAHKDDTKKPKFSTHESSLSSSSGDDTGKNSSGIKVVDLDQATSCVSDLTDSNKGSYFHHKSERPRSRTRNRGQPQESEGGTVESDIVVTKQDEDQPSDSVPLKRKKSAMSAHSLSPGFELDYREVFINSNVPQLIATTAGRIVAYNDFFLAITGMSASDVERATIFSFVKSSKLSNLFEIVAKSLRSADPKDAEIEASSATVSNLDTRTSNGWNYEAMTLPCVRFPAEHAKQLYVTVTLMTDVDPRKRCFHCVLTDSPCTNGDIGRITPELLEILFASKKAKCEKK